MSKKTTIIAVIIGALCSFISASSIYWLFDSVEGFKTEIRQSKAVVKEMQSQVNSIENKYNSEIQYWEIKNNRLNKKIQQTESQLKQSRQQAGSRQGKIQSLITESKILKDTGEIVANCDSLKAQVIYFIEETATRDSLYDSEIADLKTIVQNKDSALTTCERSLLAIKDITDVALVQQKALTERLNEADRKARREKRKSRFLSAAVLVLSGVTASLLLK